MPILEDCGPVARMDLPQHWEEEAGATASPTRPKLVAFHPAGVYQAGIYVRSPGRANDKEAQRLWERLVQRQAPRRLKQAEIKELELLPGYAFGEARFQRRVVRSEDLRGKRVLVAEGYWPPQGLDMYIVMADTGGKANEIHEIYYAALRRVYPMYLDVWLKSLESVRWKRHGAAGLLNMLLFWKR
jgi:hypothetical protein